MSRAAATKCRTAGFTLIEVLVAFVILAAALGVAFEVFAVGLRSGRAADGYTRATLLAESTLERFAAGPMLSARSESGELEDGFGWTATVRPYPLEGDESRAIRAIEVKVTVAWRDGGGRRSVSLTTLRVGKAAP